MNYAFALQVLQTENKLPHDDPCLFLPESSALLEQALEVQTVCEIIEHVNLALRFDRLIVLDAEVASQQVVDLDLCECLE